MIWEHKDIIAWWGAALSTILGAITVRAKMSRVKFYYELEWVFESRFDRDEPYMTFSIVNTSEKAIVIRNIIVERYLSFNKIVPAEKKKEYSEKLSHGEQYKHRMSLSIGSFAVATIDLNQTMSIPGGKKLTIDPIEYPSKIRLKVTDTTGKSYRTKWIHLKKLKRRDRNIIKW